MVNQRLREVIYMAKVNDMEINEITVSPSLYNELKAEAVYTCTYDTQGPNVLRFNNVTIKKRPCKGCCQHD